MFQFILVETSRIKTKTKFENIKKAKKSLASSFENLLRVSDKILVSDNIVNKTRTR